MVSKLRIINFYNTKYDNNYYFFPEEGGVRQDELINWYLKEIESEIETVQELTDKKLLVEKVIDRLVHHVSHMTSKLLSCDLDVYYCTGSCAVAVGDGGGWGRGGIRGQPLPCRSPKLCHRELAI